MAGLDDRSSSPAHQRPGASRGHGKRRARPTSTGPAPVSNRSSPEVSPERSLKIRPLTETAGSTDRNGKSRRTTRSPDRRSQQLQQPASSSHSSSSFPPEDGYPQVFVNGETPANEKLAYFGSNESERSDSINGDEGDASSSEDSATEMLDAVLGLEKQPFHIRNGSSGSMTTPRRELLVQRHTQEPNFTTSWENALFKPKRPSFSQPRTRSLTPSGSSPLPARRKASPTSEVAPLLGSSNSRSPSPSRPSSPPAPVPKRSRIAFRLDLLPEVALLTASLILAAVRMAKLEMPMDLNGQTMPDIPLSPLIMLIFAIPGVSLFRRRDSNSNFTFPFTDERGYRSPATVDDGFAAGASIPVLLAAGFLWDAVSRRSQEPPMLGNVRSLMEVWQSAGIHPKSGITDPTSAQIHSTVVVARISLLLSTSINSFILIFHIVLSRTLLRVERLPTNNTRRLFGALLLACTVSFVLWALLALNHAFAWSTPYISPLEAACSSLIYQVSMYSVTRLVRRGFTLGELSLAIGSGISLFLEFWRVTSGRFFYAKYGGIPATFRLPTPLVPFQHVLIPGAFLTGFLLSPLLLLSRNFAQMPSHRLRRPEERGKNRKWVALGVFGGLVLVVFLPFGGWAGWSLGGNSLTAWAWALRFSLLGGDGVYGSQPRIRGIRRWSRLFLALYWLAIVMAAVGGWQTRLVRARRLRLAKSKSAAKAPDSTVQSNLVPNKSALDTVEARGLRGDRRMYAALDLRRKFFHALAVIMFVPAIAIDPAFTSLAFSLAFAIFTFAEYARYFAVYPVGAPIHVFFSEFVDSKDAGPVILSHFYLLTGCAGGLWLEGAGINLYTGVFAVGIGDAFASILGRRIGIAKWPNSNKTLFGTLSFILSVFGAAMLLRAIGLVAHFSSTRYLIATTAAGLLEAMSAQNDNLVIPIFFWSVIALLEVD